MSAAYGGKNRKNYRRKIRDVYVGKKSLISRGQYYTEKITSLRKKGRKKKKKKICLKELNLCRRSQELRKNITGWACMGKRIAARDNRRMKRVTILTLQSVMKKRHRRSDRGGKGKENRVDDSSLSRGRSRSLLACLPKNKMSFGKFDTNPSFERKKGGRERIGNLSKVSQEEKERRGRLLSV